MTNVLGALDTGGDDLMPKICVQFAENDRQHLFLCFPIVPQHNMAEVRGPITQQHRGLVGRISIGVVPPSDHAPPCPAGSTVEMFHDAWSIAAGKPARSPASKRIVASFGSSAAGR